MMEEVKELLHLIEKLPHMALWVLGGFALYKLITYASLVGSVTMVARLAIIKWSDYKMRPVEVPREPPREWKLRDMVIGEGDKIALEAALATTRLRRVKPGSYVGAYLHSDDVSFIVEAIEEKLKKEKEKA